MKSVEKNHLDTIGLAFVYRLGSQQEVVSLLVRSCLSCDTLDKIGKTQSCFCCGEENPEAEHNAT